MEKEVIRTVEHDFEYDSDLPIVVKNITQYSKISQPRRKNVIDKSAEIYLKRFKLLTLDRHWLPGEKLSELDWLEEARQIKNNPVEDCFKLFELYCIDSLQFLLGDYYVLHLMQSPWNHQTIMESLHDFMEAFNVFYQAQVEIRFLIPKIGVLEKDWKAWQKDHDFVSAILLD